MVMNKVKGNMYSWCDFTWNPIKGKCPHKCSYCYYQNNPRYKDKIGKLRLDEKCFKDNLGKDNIIFVGSSVDMWADDVPRGWICKALNHCFSFDNTYLFQTKNPKRFLDFVFTKKTILGITLETNRATSSKTAPTPFERINAFSDKGLKNFEKMISIEPIMDFDSSIIVWIKQVPHLKFVSIGADSKGHNLLEPSRDKVQMLIKELKKFTEVKLKDNLKRLRNA